MTKRTLIALALLLTPVSVQAQNFCTVSGGGSRTLTTAPIDDARFLVQDEACPASANYKAIEYDALLADIFSSASAVCSSCIPLGTSTSGNYVDDILAGVGIAVTHTPGEGSDATCSLSFADAGTDPNLGAAGATFSSEGASAAGLVFEGDTNDAHELRMRITDPTAERILTVPNADSTTVQPDAGSSNNFLTAISSAGVISKAQPAFSNISGTNSDAQVDGTGETDEVVGSGVGGRSLTCGSGVCDSDAELYEKTKCINIDPAHSTTDWLFFRAERAITLVGIDCIVDAATSVAMTLRECNSNAASCGDSEAAITCATTNTTEASSIDDTAVDAGDWMRVTRGSMSGSPTQAILCVTYTVAD